MAVGAQRALAWAALLAWGARGMGCAHRPSAFVGRAGGLSDLVGEKLQERFVADRLDEVLPQSPPLCTLIPIAGPPARYALLSDQTLPTGTADRLDAALRTAHHYGLARELGQLAPLTVHVSPEAARWVAERAMRRGMAWGDIKPRVLQPHPADADLQRALQSAGEA